MYTKELCDLANAIRLDKIKAAGNLWFGPPPEGTPPAKLADFHLGPNPWGLKIPAQPSNEDPMSGYVPDWRDPDEKTAPGVGSAAVTIEVAADDAIFCADNCGAYAKASKVVGKQPQVTRSVDGKWVTVYKLAERPTYVCPQCAHTRMRMAANAAVLKAANEKK